MFTKNEPIIATQQIRKIRKITIWGVGLIGGSLGLALKANGFQGKRVGLGRNVSRLEKAQEMDAVDEITIEIAEAVHDSDLVILCPPVNYVPLFVKQILEFVESPEKHIVLTDVGSTKSVIVKTVETFLQDAPTSNISFVGAHPMAGSDETGVIAARSSLFNDAKCIITPTENTENDALQLVRNLWEFVGAEPVLISPDVHDELIGAASHLPHLIASLLVNCIATVETPDGRALDFTATGFKDTTRIAAGSPELWTSIFSQNSDVILHLIDSFVDNLTGFKNLLMTDNQTEIHRMLQEIQEIVIKQRET